VFWFAQTLLFQLCCTETNGLYHWSDLQMSVSTVSTKHFARSETPSSILSSDSDIRFTRKLGAHYRCGCCILAGFLLFLLLAAAAVYLGRKYFYTWWLLIKSSIHPYMALQPLPDLGLPHKTPPFSPIFNSFPPSSYPQHCNAPLCTTSAHLVLGLSTGLWCRSFRLKPFLEYFLHPFLLYDLPILMFWF